MGGGARSCARRTVKRGESSPARSPGSGADLLIRPAQSQDVVLVERIEQATFGDPWSVKGFIACLARDEILFEVAEVRSESDTRVAAYAVMWFADDQAELANLAVAPDLRGRGYGAQMLDHLLATSRSRAVSDVFLEVRDSNVAALALYRSRRFEEVGRRQKYYRAPVEDALIMRRVL